MGMEDIDPLFLNGSAAFAPSASRRTVLQSAPCLPSGVLAAEMVRSEFRRGCGDGGAVEAACDDGPGLVMANAGGLAVIAWTGAGIGGLESLKLKITMAFCSLSRSQM